MTMPPRVISVVFVIAENRKIVFDFNGKGRTTHQLGWIEKDQNPAPTAKCSELNKSPSVFRPKAQVLSSRFGKRKG